MGAEASAQAIEHDAREAHAATATLAEGGIIGSREGEAMKASELIDMILWHAGASQTMTPEVAKAQARAGKLSSEAIGKALDAYVDERIALALRDNKVRGKS